MRLVRAAGQNVSPSDDGRLYDQIFSDGLFTETSFASLGADSVRIGAMYGDLCGRDFTIEQQTITVQLPEGEGETTGYIYVEIDLSAETPLSVGSALAPFTPTYEDINVNGAVCQMIVAEYTATALAVTSVTAVYERAAASSVKAGSIATVENSTATEAHDVGEYILLNGQMYIITAAVSIGETFIEGTNISAVSIGDELTSLNAGLIDFTLLANLTHSGTTYQLAESVENFKLVIAVLYYSTFYLNTVEIVKPLWLAGQNVICNFNDGTLRKGQFLINGNTSVTTTSTSAAWANISGIYLYGVKG